MIGALLALAGVGAAAGVASSLVNSGKEATKAKELQRASDEIKKQMDEGQKSYEEGLADLHTLFTNSGTAIKDQYNQQLNVGLGKIQNQLSASLANFDQQISNMRFQGNMDAEKRLRAQKETIGAMITGLGQARQTITNSFASRRAGTSGAALSAIGQALGDYNKNLKEVQKNFDQASLDASAQLENAIGNVAFAKGQSSQQASWASADLTSNVSNNLAAALSGLATNEAQAKINTTNMWNSEKRGMQRDRMGMTAQANIAEDNANRAPLDAILAGFGGAMQAGGNAALAGALSGAFDKISKPGPEKTSTFLDAMNATVSADGKDSAEVLSFNPDK